MFFIISGDAYKFYDVHDFFFFMNFVMFMMFEDRLKINLTWDLYGWIGLDVVAQHNIQKFLRYYQQLKKISILLTSHYMKDVVALCNRVVIVAQGVIIHDGSLAGIVDRFSGHKVITLQFADHNLPHDLEKYGEIIEEQPPRLKLRVEKQNVTSSLGAILQRHPIEDVSVEDLPLEQVIAGMFSIAHQGDPHELETSSTSDS